MHDFNFNCTRYAQYVIWSILFVDKQKTIDLFEQKLLL